MSSTNRGGGVYVRHEDDHYATPEWCTEGLFEVLTHCQKAHPDCLGNEEMSRACAAADLSITSVLDPCCGEGGILKVASRRGYSAFGIEIDEGRGQTASAIGYTVEIGDALAPAPWEPVDLIVTNPPFFAAREFIDRALAQQEKMACAVAFLLRLNFLGSQKRALLHRKRPANIYVMSKRPSFTPNGKTDSIEYAWFVWPADGSGGRWALL